MNELHDIIISHLKKYNITNPTDLLKLIYQNVFGSGHLLADAEKVRSFIESEIPLASATYPSYEHIGNGLCRLSISTLLNTTLSADTYQRIFTLSASESMGSDEEFLKKCCEVAQLLGEMDTTVDGYMLNREVEKWVESGKGLFSHSDEYKKAHNPRYRVVKKQYCDFLALFTEIDRQLTTEGAPVVIAIDGNCGSGKSTLANMLSDVYNCPTISMDHFFLREGQRTSERLAEVGGNVDYERFSEEVLAPLSIGDDFSYRPYRCDIGEFGEIVHVRKSDVYVIEGTYSLRPDLRSRYSLKVFLSVEAECQRERIIARNGEQLWQMFRDVWIPMENRYFERFNIADIADIRFET